MATAVAELAIKMVTEVETEGFSTMTNAVTRLKQSATSELSSVAQAAVKAGSSLKEGVSSGSLFAIGAMGEFAAQSQGFIQDVINKVFSLKTALIGLITGAVFKTAWDWMVDPNIQLEQLELRIKSTVGDAQEAAEVFEYLKEVATMPGMDMQEVFEAGLEWLPQAMRTGEDIGDAFREGFEQAILISAQKGKPLSEVMTAIEEFYSGYGTSMARVLDIPTDVVEEHMKAMGLIGGGAEVSQEEIDELTRKERLLKLELQELNLLMQEGNDIQEHRLGSVTSVCGAVRKCAEDTEKEEIERQRRQISIAQKEADLARLTEEREEKEVALAQQSEAGMSNTEKGHAALIDLMDEAGISADYLIDRENTLGYTIDYIISKAKEFGETMGAPVSATVYTVLEELAGWIEEHEGELSEFATLVGEKIAGGIENMANWLSEIDWEGVGASLESWGNALAPVASSLEEILTIINSWPDWAKTLLVGAVALQATTGGALNIITGAPGAAAVAKSALTGGTAAAGAEGVGAAAAGIGLGPVALMVAGAAAMAALTYAGMENWQSQWADLTLEQRQYKAERMERQGLAGGRWKTEGLKDYQRENVNITVEAKNSFQFDGTLSSTEQARLMEDWADALDEGFVKPLTKRLEESYRH